MDITVRLQGGLGNQLFQYAAGLSLKKCMGPNTSLHLIMLEENKHNHLGHDYSTDLFVKGTKITEYTPTVPYIQYSAFEPWYPELLIRRGPSIYLDGYFQYLPAISDILPELRISFINALCKKTGLLLKQKTNTGFVHVRRGDYLKNPTYHWVQTPEYYEKGMRTIGLDRWTVFSDDIEWCKKQICFEQCIFAEDDNELRSLLVMISCCGGAVISNSSFSWWAAIFGAHEYGGRVVYPELWSEHHKPTLFPDEWLQI
jgi:hypothetical protein